MKNLRFSKVSLSIATLALLAVFSLAGCGGGGGGGGSVETANTAPQIISAPEIFAKADNAYIYKVSSIDNDGDSLSYSLTAAPSGMEVNPQTGTISWVPTASQGGEHDVTVNITDGKETAAQSFKVRVETSNTLASKFITATTGGTVEAVDPAGLISDVQITIPSGVLSSDTTMFVSKLSNPSYLPDDVPAFEVVADTPISATQSARGMKAKFKAATLPQPITITVKYSDDILSSPFINNDETQLEVWTDASYVLQWTPAEIVSRDTAQNIITAKVDRPFGKVGVGSNRTRVIKQKRTFETFKGSEDSFWNESTKKNLLIIHGITASSEDFTEENDFIIYFRDKNNHYDNILFYNYPSFELIEENAMALNDYILSRNRNAKFDIVAHSMGGLVSRWLIEALGSQNVEHLFMVGTPNFRANVDTFSFWSSWKMTFPALSHLSPGGKELFRLDSEPNFLDRLNFPPDLIQRRGNTKYYWYTGDVGNGIDGWVPIPTSAELSLLGLSDGLNAITYPYDHSQLHEECATNGICDEIKNVITTPPPPSADTMSPTVQTFSVFPNSIIAGSAVNISYTVSDTGGSSLNRVELWRANDDGGNPRGWAEIKRNPHSGNGPVTGTFSDTPSTGTYWYGIHVVDNVGNWTPEPNRIQVVSAASQTVPPSVSWLAINNGASSTTSRTVTLNNTATSKPTWYLASENSNFSGASWQVYLTYPTFTLSPGNGTKIVYFKVKNSASESSILSDIITLNEATTTQYTLTVTKSGTGSGTVAAIGLSCSGSTCTGSYNQGTPVTLSASALSGSTFVGWSGGGCSGIGACTVTMDAAKTVTATFTLQSSTSTPPGAFTLSVTAGCTGSSPKNSLSWTPSSGVTGYYAVYRCTGAGCTPTLYNQSASTGTTFDNTSVVAGTSYTYFVGASNAYGTTYSNWITVTPSSCTTGTPPGAFTLSVTAGCTGSSPKNSLSWTPSSGVTGYYAVYRCTGAGCTPTLYNQSASTGTTFDNTSVVAGTSYTYFVGASNAYGTTYSNWIPVTTSSICP